MCRDYFSKSLIFVGEFGVNDYNFVWSAGKSENEVRSYVPQVVEKIVRAVEVYITSYCLRMVYIFLYSLLFRLVFVVYFVGTIKRLHCIFLCFLNPIMIDRT